MGQLQVDEFPTTHANVDQLLDELQQLAKYAKPVDQRLEADSASEQQSGIVVKGR